MKVLYKVKSTVRERMIHYQATEELERWGKGVGRDQLQEKDTEMGRWKALTWHNFILPRVIQAPKKDLKLKWQGWDWVKDCNCRLFKPPELGVREMWEQSGDPGCRGVRLSRLHSGSSAGWLWPWVNYFTFWCLSFLICEMRMVLMPASGGYSEDDILNGT